MARSGRPPLQRLHVAASQPSSSSRSGCDQQEIKGKLGPRLSLTTQEQQLHDALSLAAVERYDDGCAKHRDLLCSLWVQGRLGTRDCFEAVSPVWQRLGFQQPNPTQDLRGAGMLGLRQMHHFCERGGALEVVMRAEAEGRMEGGAPFPLAAASLNVTHLLASHLRLLPGCAYATGAPRCSESTWRNFLCFSIDVQPASAVDLMHAELLRALAEHWREMQRPGLTPLHLALSLSAVSEHMQAVLARASAPWEMSSILLGLRSCSAALSSAHNSCVLGSLCSDMAGSWRTWLQHVS